MRGLGKKKLKLFKCYQKNYEFRGDFMGLIDKIIELFQVLFFNKKLDTIQKNVDSSIKDIDDSVKK